MVALAHAIVLGMIFAFASAGTLALAPANPGRDATHGTTFDKHPHEFDCTSFPGGGRRLHCHLTSTGTEATGPVRSLDDQPALVTCSAILPARSANMVSALAVTHIPIAGHPAYILFGNFRS